MFELRNSKDSKTVVQQYPNSAGLILSKKVDV